jgi:hypothetical protein
MKHVNIDTIINDLVSRNVKRNFKVIYMYIFEY